MNLATSTGSMYINFFEELVNIWHVDKMLLCMHIPKVEKKKDCV